MTNIEKRVLESKKWKKSNQWCADHIGISLKQFLAIKRGAATKTINEEYTKTKHVGKSTYTSAGSKSSVKYDLDKGTGSIQIESPIPLSPEEIIDKFRIDTNQWRLSGYWNKEQLNGTYLVSANITQLKQEERVVDSFKDFLKTYKPESKVLGRNFLDKTLQEGSLIINKQDFHANKWDSDGNNNIGKRFAAYDEALEKTLQRAEATHRLNEIVYIIGSDHFNSEWNYTKATGGQTVKGTPQDNILTYHQAFELVCNHEVNIIEQLLVSADKVRVYYLVGNHDASVSYHMVTWLQAYFRNQERLYISNETDFTQYFTLEDTAVCINHGDVQKPERLAQNFPLEYKSGFFNAENHIILIGDRHSELTKDVGGITFYQIPALTTAKGHWDKQMGYTTTKAKMTSFLIEPYEGVTDVIKIRMN